ncbi:MAG: GIY-YIG nuclease family protein [Chloroflexota bacterium]|nr:GIY-YIG nuclease family protein [Chloroflexota bacterium]
MAKDFWRAVEKMKLLMDKLKDTREFKYDEYGEAPQKGVYVLYENGKATYVGRSNTMRRRIREHGADNSDRYSATFAFRLLRRELNDPKGTAQDIQETYREEYRQQHTTTLKPTRSRKHEGAPTAAQRWLHSTLG